MYGSGFGETRIDFCFAFAFTLVAAGGLKAEGFQIPDTTRSETVFNSAGHNAYGATPTSTPSATPASRLGNISTRAFVQTVDNAMIGGLNVQGTEPKRVIIRAIGPELIRFGVPDVLADPILELHDSTGVLIA